MTVNQIRIAELREQARHNAAVEGESQRANRAGEALTGRKIDVENAKIVSNEYIAEQDRVMRKYISDSELARKDKDIALRAEQIMKDYEVAMKQYNESVRHNKQTEAQKWVDTALKGVDQLQRLIGGSNLLDKLGILKYLF